MKSKNILLLSLLIFAVLSACVQEQVQLPVTTLPPATTLPPETQPTTSPPVTQPPTTAPPTTTALPTTAPPPTTPPPAKILEVYDVAVTEDANLKTVVNGKVRNNGNATMFNVMVTATFYNNAGQVVKTEKTAPKELAPGQSADFKMLPDILRTSIQPTFDVEGSLTPIQATTPPTKVNVAIRNYAFSPSTLTVKKGTTVTWINDDSVPHSIMGGAFKSANLNNGGSYSFVFNEAGEYSYNCGVHPSTMKGKIIVEQ